MFDKKRNMMSLIVDEKNSTIDNNIIKKNIISKEIICPICIEPIRMKIEDYQIILYECKNDHIINNILLKEYENLQKIDELKIICDICKSNNKANSFENKFYKCNSCKINLCPLCESTHDKSHNLVNYDQKNFYCEIHNNELYYSFCNECKKNLCIICESNHDNNHHKKIIAFSNIIPNKDNINKELNDFKNLINIFKKEIEKFKDKLDNIFKNIIQNFDIYYKIYNNIFNNFDIKNRNFQNLKNMNDINYKNVKNNISNY